MNVPAIWLKAAPGGADIIYPIRSISTWLKAGTVYSVDEFLATIGPELERRRAGKAPRGGG